jgi:hypothetical protein
MTSHVKQFIANNTEAFNTASKVFAQIEAKSDEWIETLARAGIVGADIKPFAVAYVASQKGAAQPHTSRNGGELTFTKDTPEHSRVKYLVAVATGAAQAKAAKRSSGKVDMVAKILKMYAELTPAQKRAIKAAL